MTTLIDYNNDAKRLRLDPAVTGYFSELDTNTGLVGK